MSAEGPQPVRSACQVVGVSDTYLLSVGVSDT
ncbi:MAG: hypothetical protein ACI945_001916 [Pseudohongiellaceae bacterium]|jgi:hypothetical protein